MGKYIKKELIDFFTSREGWDKDEILNGYIEEIFTKYYMTYDGKTPIAPDELVISYGESPMDLKLPVNIFADELFEKIIEGVCNVIKTA